jgi:hypothetical protein
VRAVRISVVFTALGLFLLSTGCGEGPKEQTDGEAVVGVLSSFADQASNPKTLKVYFADGKAPPDGELMKYKNKGYEVVGQPRASGGTVTARVKVTDETKGGELGEADWTFVKAGDKWKLESAPLP